MTSVRKIAVVTGTRAEYGLLKPVIDAIIAHPVLKLQLVVTGMHLDPEFGYSINEIRKDQIPVTAEIPLDMSGDDNIAMSRSVGAGILGMTDVLTELKPDVVLVLGDRTEILAAAIAAAYLNIPLAHIHGGDKTKGGLDESVRHAVTKFAHIHFPATVESAKRVERLGEEKERIFVTGAPCLDTILHHPLLSQQEIENHFHVRRHEYALVVQHPVSTEPEIASRQMHETLEALKTLNQMSILVYPNSDAGGRAMIREIQKYESEPWLKTFPNLKHTSFLSLMRDCKFMLGNSSSGIIESSSFKVPVINLGIRQANRQRAANVIDAPHEKEAIIASIQKACSKEFQRSLTGITNPYGEGNTGVKIAEILANIELDKVLIQKQITY